jgi:hypothetical protein
MFPRSSRNHHPDTIWASRGIVGTVYWRNVPLGEACERVGTYSLVAQVALTYDVLNAYHRHYYDIGVGWESFQPVPCGVVSP